MIIILTVVFRITLQERISSLESANADLASLLATTQTQLTAAQARLVQHNAGLVRHTERERDELAEEVARLRKKLETYADYDEIKRELEIMKACSYFLERYPWT